MNARLMGCVVGALAALAVAGCGGSDDASPTNTRPTSVPDTTTAPTTEPAPRTTTSAPVTVPRTAASTVAPSTTSTPTTVAPTTTTPITVAPGSGWAAAEFTPAASPVGYSGNWEGEPSPPAPAGEAPLADGYYDAEVLSPWDAANPGVLHVELRRFGYCRDLPADSCEPNDEDANELGRDPSWTRSVEVALDASTNVVLTGFRCDGETKRGTGADLADLFTAFDAAYQTVIAPSVAAGTADYDIAQAVSAAPSAGFLPETPVCGELYAGPLRFEHGEAPMLLLQVVTRFVADGPAQPLTPTDLMRLNGVDVRGGVMTYYFYAGYYS